MSCRIVQKKIEAGVHLSILAGDDAMSRHLDECVECSAYIEARRLLLQRLQWLANAERQARPEFEQKVLERYRARFGKPVNTDFALEPRPSAWKRLPAWVTVAASLALLILINTTFQEPNSSPRVSVVPEAAAPSGASTIQKVESPLDLNPIARAQRARRAKHHVQAAETSATMERRAQPLRQSDNERAGIETFRPLVYCDNVTCNGPMQVVQVKIGRGGEVPPLKAELLVGMDGVARAIRVVN